MQGLDVCFLSSGNRAGKRKRVIQTFDEGELRRSLRDKPAKTSEPVLPARPGRKRRADQAGPDMKKRKPGRPPGRGPGRPPVLHSPGISSKGPLPTGWSVSLKDSEKEIGKKFKQYKVSPCCFRMTQLPASSISCIWHHLAFQGMVYRHAIAIFVLATSYYSPSPQSTTLPYVE